MTASVHWRVHLHPDVVRYIFQLRWEGTALRQAIASLTTNGVPNDASKTPESDFYLWVEARHWIVFRVEKEERTIYVTNVELTG